MCKNFMQKSARIAEISTKVTGGLLESFSLYNNNCMVKCSEMLIM